MKLLEESLEAQCAQFHEESMGRTSKIPEGFSGEISRSSCKIREIASIISELNPLN